MRRQPERQGQHHSVIRTPFAIPRSAVFELLEYLAESGKPSYRSQCNPNFAQKRAQAPCSLRHTLENEGTTIEQILTGPPPHLSTPTGFGTGLACLLREVLPGCLTAQPSPCAAGLHSETRRVAPSHLVFQSALPPRIAQTIPQALRDGSRNYTVTGHNLCSRSGQFFSH